MNFLSRDEQNLSRLAAARNELPYHEVRVLLIVAAVAHSEESANGRLDGLTKLAKLDFLIRYPHVATRVLDLIDASDDRLHLDREADGLVTDPMIRYKFGPWDARYYSIVGSLVGRGLMSAQRGTRNQISFAPTQLGNKVLVELVSKHEWRAVGERCSAIAEAAAGMSGTQLKDLVYARLPEMMDRPYREEIS